MKIFTYDPGKQKKVFAGNFKNGVFYNRVKKKHYMRLEKGYGIQEDIVQKLKELGCNQIVLSCIDKASFFNMAYVERLEPKDYGNGPQRFLGAEEEPEKTNKNQIGLEI